MDASVDELLAAWGIRTRDVRPVGEGTNNTSWYVGDDFVLRIHRNTRPPQYEHALLHALHGLSFDVPTPLPAEDGRTLVRRELHGEPVTASLSRRIRGEHPRRGDAVQAEACGEALAELDLALAGIDPATLPPPRVWDGDLTKVHARVPDLDAMVASLEGADRRQEVARILAATAGVGRGLPQSIIHADFWPTNVLLDGSSVTGVLDFEAAGPGFRAMDLAIGLWSFGADTHDAFRRGYLARLPLTDVEQDAVPALQLLREATSLVHWYGRHLEGLTTAADITARADRLRQVAAVRRTGASRP
ncbi:phosphotransferase enzyme family protein [Kribbella sp. CA-247076]|uniref:phosphotransferase enzyme family protein n=1 Tax=Kribbella sp. CA-247076 TaxID=3239941 RepID=UPI003D92E737